MEDLFLGIDIGSSNIKGVVISGTGNILARDHSSYKILSSAPGRAEHNPDEFWWQGLLTVMSGLEETVELSAIKAIGITGLVPVFVGIDERGQPLSPAILHIDNRARKQVEILRGEFGLEVNTENILPTILWFKENRPWLYRKLAAVLSPHGYLVYKLTGRMTVDYDNADMMGGIFREEKCGWDRELLAEIGIKSDIFPAPLAADSVAGSLTESAAAVTGLSPGIPIVTGTGDSFTTLIGSGVFEPGQGLIYLGTSATFIIPGSSVDKYIDRPHFRAGRADFAAKVLSCGEGLEKLRAVFNRDFSDLNNRATEISPSENKPLFFPHFRSRNEKQSAGGAKIVNWQSNHNYGHLYRAFLEGIAFELYKPFSTGRHLPQTLHVSGGCARSRVFLETVAGVLERRLVYLPEAGADIGAALLAARAVKDYNIQDWKEIIAGQEMINVQPDREHIEIYRKLFREYINYGA